MRTITEPHYTIQPSESGVRFHLTAEAAEAHAAANSGRVVPAVQVDPDIRAEGTEWMGRQV